MGEERVILPKKQKQVQEFVQRILRDTQALEQMLHEDMFEKEPIRIGAEQELNLIDRHFQPACLNLEILEKLNHPAFTTELARFNLEANMDPVEFKGDCLSQMENQIRDYMLRLSKVANEFDTEIILSGILPTIRKFDLEMANITPIDRYNALMEAILKMRGEGSMDFKINGIDELITRHDSPLLEGGNTGFQVHLQVTPDEFVPKYNIAQAIAAPALACATFSPILFGKRLWKETRIALFQQSVDTRISGNHLRDRSPRVMFGNDWVNKSIVEIYKEDILRFRVLLSTNLQEDSIKKLNAGEIPDLVALQIHNSTVYRWNRPCYGNAGGKPHLRIENRVLPAGPTVVDEMANAALWLGLLTGMGDHYPNITRDMEFDHAKSNFLLACRNGLDTTTTWVKGKKISTAELLKEELLPIAAEGLAKRNVDKADIDRYMDLLHDRISTRQTGSQWILDSYSKLVKETTKDEALVTITASILANQRGGDPVHTWDLANITHLENWQPSSLSVEEFMSKDLFTVQEDDIIELVAEMMDHQKLRYIPVEDAEGKLKGVITSRILLRYYSRQANKKRKRIVTVKELMIKQPLTILPQSRVTKALEIMQKNVIGCLPVVNNEGQLVGIITEQDFLTITGRLIYRYFDKD